MFGAILAAVAPAVINGFMGKKASKDAANAQREGAEASNALQLQIFEQQREDQQPFRDRGNLAGNALAAGLGLGSGDGRFLRTFTGADMASDPGFQFGLNQGVQAIDRSAASRGGLYSGATLKALNRFGNDYGSTKFGEAFNRDQISKNQQFNALSGLAGTGQVATNQVGAAGANYANAAGANILGAANATAAGRIGGANAISGAIGQGMNFYQQQKMLDSLRRPSDPIAGLSNDWWNTGGGY